MGYRPTNHISGCEINLDLLPKFQFDTDIQYERYVKSHEHNQKYGNGYIIGVWNLLNHFIMNKSTSENTVTNFQNHLLLTSNQIEIAKEKYNHIIKGE